jgi:thiol-disulfide isomerase/thioredoxin
MSRIARTAWQGCWAALMLLATAARADTEWQRMPEANPAPAIELPTIDGTVLDLASLRGKVVLVNFWATWCEPCIAEMPSLEKLRTALGSSDFEVLGVNFKEGPERINAFVEKAGVTFPIVRDTDGAVSRNWAAHVLPVTYLVDRNGRVRYRLVGEADWTDDRLTRTIRELVAAPRSR